MVITYIVVFACSLALALVLTPAVIYAARRRGLYDPRDPRKVHVVPTPRLGGVAIVLSTMTVAISVMLIGGRIGDVFAEYHMHLIVLLATSGFIFLLGVLDDLFNLPAKLKLLAQLVAALTVCAFGIQIGKVVLFGWDFGWLSWPITIAWIVGITNAVNLIDGLDGLSAGISAATCATIAGFAIFTGQAAMAILMLTLLGSLVGFLVFNFNPAKIFMGDSGSMFLGFFLATASVVCATKVATIMGLILPALALGLPIFDMVLSILRRVLERRSVFSPDREHVHHRLIDMGIKHHHVVMILYIVTLLATGAGLLMMALRGHGEIIIVLVTLLLLLSVFRLAGVLRFRHIWEQLQVNLARNREIRLERKQFESLRVRFRRAWTFDQWWRAVRRMARRMDFVELTVYYITESSTEAETLSYHRAGRSKDADLMQMSIPVQRKSDVGLTKVEIRVPVNEPLETIGRRLSLFGRLLDEHPPGNLKEWDRVKATVEETA